MRKRILFAATGAMYLMLASCSADEPVAQNTTDGVINYSVVAANQSRAAHSYCANNMPDGFKVWAKHGNNIYIDGDDIEKNSNKYVDVTGIRFWPVNSTGDYDPLTFYAVADGNFAEGSASGITFDNVNMAVKDYTIKDNVAEQLDLMYAVKTDATYDKSVTLNFRHALSQICFKAMNENHTTTRITVKEIAVCGLDNTGTYTLPSTSTDGNTNVHGDTPTTINGTPGTWETSGNANYTITIGEDNAGIVLSNTAQYLNVAFTTDHKNMNWSKVLNLLPQNQPAAAITDNNAPTGSGVYFKLTLVVENISKELNFATNKYENVVYEKVHDGEVFELYIGANIVWKEGNRYIYTFNFGKNWSPANLKDVTYTVSTDDFIEKEINSIINGHEAVLMRDATATEEALYVATKNIGAIGPEDSGLYFWWGDIIGYPSNDNNVFIFSNVSSVVETNGLNLSTDPNKSDWLENEALKSEKDAAVQKWGGAWRMPTKADLDWLKNNCTWTDVMKDGKLVGVKVVSNTTGGEIYLPAAACYQNDDRNGPHKPGNGKYFDNICFYWSSTVSHNNNGGANTHAFRLKKESGKIDISDGGLRYDGFPIRPVANPSSTNS